MLPAAGVLGVLLLAGVFGFFASGQMGPGALQMATPEGADSPRPAVEDTASVARFHEGIELTARSASHTASDPAQEPATSVWVSVANESGDDLVVQASAFLLRDAEGRLHTPRLGADPREIGGGELVALRPGERVAGTVTAPGRFDPEQVNFYPDNSGVPVTAPVTGIT